MIGDFEGPVERQTEAALEVENAPPSEVLRRRPAIEDQIVIGLRAVGVRGHPGHGPGHVGSLREPAELRRTGIEIPQKNDVVFVRPGRFHGGEHVDEGINFLWHLVRVGVDVDHPEGERLRVRDDPRAETDMHGGPMELVGGIGDDADRSRIDLDPIHVVKEAVLLLAHRPPLAGADDPVVPAAVGVHRVDEAGDHPVRLRPHLLDGNDVELADDAGEDLHDVRLGDLRFAEHLDVERGDENCIPRPRGGEHRRSGGSSDRGRGDSGSGRGDRVGGLGRRRREAGEDRRGGLG